MMTNSYISLECLLVQFVVVTCSPTSLSIDVWGCPMDTAESKKFFFLCFPKAKAQQEKIALNCMQLKKKVSQYFDTRFLFVGAI